MFRRFSVNFALFSILVDGLVVCAGLAVATTLRPRLGFLPFAAPFPRFIPTPWMVYLLFAIEWTAILNQFSVYDGRRNLRALDEFTSLTLGSLLAAVALSGTLYISFREVSRLLFIVFILITYIALLAWRTIARMILNRLQQSPDRMRQVLIIGAGAVGREVQKQIESNPLLGLRLAGFLDDDPEKRGQHPEILGPLSKLAEVVTKERIDDVVIALPQRAYKRTDQLVGELHRLPVKVWVIPDYFRLALHKAAIEEFAGLPMLDLRAPALTDQQRLVKRAFDLGVVLLSLPVNLPLMGMIALLVRLETPGPVIFRQTRVGENGRLFEMLKFRTMRQEAEEQRHLVEKTDEAGNLIHKHPDDPRITRIGRRLRRLSLDELPQLWNVLRGEMSLVGPRPELPYLVEKYEDWQRQRFAVPQGLTGWWQINGRSDRPMHLNTEDDLYYVQNFSLLLDVYILVKTVGTVVQGRGAF